MMGGHGGGGLLTLVDRKTRFTRIEPVLWKHADHVADVIIGALSDIKGQVHTLTMDNGNEFAQHKRVAKALLAKVYFATRIVPGSAVPTKTPTGYYASISPRELTLRRSLKLTFGGLKTDSITDPEKHWSFDHQTRSLNSINHQH